MLPPDIANLLVVGLHPRCVNKQASLQDKESLFTCMNDIGASRVFKNRFFRPGRCMLIVFFLESSICFIKRLQGFVELRVHKH